MALQGKGPTRTELFAIIQEGASLHPTVPYFASPRSTQPPSQGEPPELADNTITTSPDHIRQVFWDALTTELPSKTRLRLR